MVGVGWKIFLEECCYFLDPPQFHTAKMLPPKSKHQFLLPPPVLGKATLLVLLIVYSQELCNIFPNNTTVVNFDWQFSWPPLVYSFLSGLLEGRNIIDDPLNIFRPIGLWYGCLDQNPCQNIAFGAFNFPIGRELVSNFDSNRYGINRDSPWK